MERFGDSLYEHAARMAERGDLSIAPTLAELPGLTEAERDALDFGLVQLDDDGTVLAYNRTESEFTGLEPEDVVGRHFFRDVAPCTNNPLFRGVFERGLAEGRLNHLFPYTFSYRMPSTNVKVHLYRDGATGTNWLLVKRI
ncbi:MAG: PAS domain-containing protein [Planctomycetota bacterium]